MADALVSGARAARHGGSSPFPGTRADTVMCLPFFIQTCSNKTLGWKRNFA